MLWNALLEGRGATPDRENETYNAAPVLALFRKYFVARAEVEFEPQHDTFYEVRGELKEGSCLVWLVDQDTGAPVTEKLGSCDD